MLDGEMTMGSRQDGKECHLAPAGDLKTQTVAGKAFPADYAQYRIQGHVPQAHAGRHQRIPVKVSADSMLGDIKVAVDGTMEYEGLYRVKLTLTPQKKLNCSQSDWLGAGCPTTRALMRFVGEDFQDLSGHGLVPAGQGVLYASTTLTRGKQVSASVRAVHLPGQLQPRPVVDGGKLRRLECGRQYPAGPTGTQGQQALPANFDW